MKVYTKEINVFETQKTKLLGKTFQQKMNERF